MSASKTTIGYIVQLGGIAAFALGAVLSFHHAAIAASFAGGAAAFFRRQKNPHAGCVKCDRCRVVREAPVAQASLLLWHRLSVAQAILPVPAQHRSTIPLLGTYATSFFRPNVKPTQPSFLHIATHCT